MATDSQLAYHVDMNRLPASVALRLPPTHAITTAADQPFWLAWQSTPLPSGILLTAAAIYAIAWRSIRRRGASRLGLALPFAYALGLASLAVALFGPLDTFNDESFSLHMLQHLALVQVAAPLLILGRPWQVLLQAVPTRWTGLFTHAVFGRRSGRGLWRLLAHPLTAFLAFNGCMAVWHLPGPYVAALLDERVHDLEHVSFFLSALLLWWHVLPPAPHRPPSSATARALLVFGSGMVGDVIAAGLTLSTRILYAPYAGRPGLGGRDALADQALGGLIMWISGGGFYLLLFWVLYGAFRADLARSDACEARPEIPT
jgi:putative membrane protein